MKKKKKSEIRNLGSIKSFFRSFLQWRFKLPPHGSKYLGLQIPTVTTYN